MDFQADDIDWQSPAGRRLDELARNLPAEPKLTLTVFGSAPLQLFIDPNFLSADVDLFAEEEATDLLINFVERQGWGKENTTQHYIQVCDPFAFRSTIDWQSRAITVERHGHLFLIVHPWDVLVSKLQRLEEKDLAAFRLVIEKTGRPTEMEWVSHLQKAVDLYRPKFEEESTRGDMLMNTQILWRELWGAEIDVRGRIIRPALLRATQFYQEGDPSLKARLAKLRLPDVPRE